MDQGWVAEVVQASRRQDLGSGLPPEITLTLSEPGACRKIMPHRGSCLFFLAVSQGGYADFGRHPGDGDWEEQMHILGLDLTRQPP